MLSPCYPEAGKSEVAAAGPQVPHVPSGTTGTGAPPALLFFTTEIIENTETTTYGIDSNHRYTQIDTDTANSSV